MRLGQLISNVIGGEELCCVEDQCLIQAIEEWIEECEWDAIVSQPRLREVGRRMAEEARSAYEAGETEEGGFGDL